MTLRPDKMAQVAKRMKDYLDGHENEPFWEETGHIALNYALLEEALRIPVSSGEDVRTGRLAGSVDLWIAQEFERAGFWGMWPRIVQPRVIDPDILHAVEALPVRDAEVGNRIVERSGSADANVMGSVYVKQVDAGLSSWLSGPELLISTKTMGGSFGKNLSNRFEEAYGDVKNLRARYPRAAHGFFFLVKSDIENEPSALEKAVHMLRQLSSSGDVYDAVCLLLVDWEAGTERVCAPSSRQDIVPDDLAPEHFFKELIRLVLREAPMDMHRHARLMCSMASIGLGDATLV